MKKLEATSDNDDHPNRSDKLRNLVSKFENVWDVTAECVRYECFWKAVAYADKLEAELEKLKAEK